MKLLVSLLMLVLALDLVAAPPQTLTRPLHVSATNQTPSFKGTAPAGTNNFYEFYVSTTLKAALGSNGIPTFVDFGAVTTSSDGSVTQSFVRTFTSAPNVLTSQLGEGVTSTNTVTITTTNFILRTSKAGQTNRWQAMGPL